MAAPRTRPLSPQLHAALLLLHQGHGGLAGSRFLRLSAIDCLVRRGLVYRPEGTALASYRAARLTEAGELLVADWAGGVESCLSLP